MTLADDRTGDQDLDLRQEDVSPLRGLEPHNTNDGDELHDGMNICCTEADKKGFFASDTSDSEMTDVTVSEQGTDKRPSKKSKAPLPPASRRQPPPPSKAASRAVAKAAPESLQGLFSSSAVPKAAPVLLALTDVAQQASPQGIWADGDTQVTAARPSEQSACAAACPVEHKRLQVNSSSATSSADPRDVVHIPRGGFGGLPHPRHEVNASVMASAHAKAKKFQDVHTDIQSEPKLEDLRKFYTQHREELEKQLTPNEPVRCRLSLGC